LSWNREERKNREAAKADRELSLPQKDAKEDSANVTFEALVSARAIFAGQPDGFCATIYENLVLSFSRVDFLESTSSQEEAEAAEKGARASQICPEFLCSLRALLCVGWVRLRQSPSRRVSVVCAKLWGGLHARQFFDRGLAGIKPAPQSIVGVYARTWCASAQSGCNAAVPR
jgi:hypothetical protein